MGSAMESGVIAGQVIRRDPAGGGLSGWSLKAVRCCHWHRDGLVVMGQSFAVRDMDGMNVCCHSFGFG
jgi:hypothetical protein